MELRIVSRAFVDLAAGSTLGLTFGNSDVFTKETLKVQTNKVVASSAANPLVMNHLWSIINVNGNWDGIISGDTLTVDYLSGGSPTSVARTVDYIVGNEIFFTTSFITSVDPNTFVLTFNIDITDFSVFEILHNLVPVGTSFAPESLLDGEVNRFTGDMSSTTLTQTYRKSGGFYKSAEQVSRSEYELVYLPLTFDSSRSVYPSWNQTLNTLKSVWQIKLYRHNSSTAFISTVFEDDLGRVGGYGEQYKTGVTTFRVTAQTTAFDYLIKNSISATFNTAPSTVEINCYVLPRRIDILNNANSGLDNIHFAKYHFTGGTLEQWGLNSETITIDNVSKTGAKYDFDIEFSQNLKDFFSLIDESDRNVVVSITAVDSVPTFDTSETHLLIFKQSEPIKIKKAVSGYLQDQAGNKYTSGGFTPRTEDLIVLGFDSSDNPTFPVKDNIKKIRLQFHVVDTSAPYPSYFIIDEQIVDLTQFPTYSNYYVANWQAGNNLRLDTPEPATRVKSNTSGLFEFRFPFFLNWRNWQRSLAATANFIDFTLPHNGLNQEWVRYAGFPTNIKVVLDFLDIDGDSLGTWDLMLHIDNYEHKYLVNDIHTTFKIYDENNNLVTSFLEGGVYRLVTNHISAYSIGTNFDWGYNAIRPKEAEVRTMIDTLNGWTSINRPLQPLVGETKAKVTIVNTKEVEISNLINTRNMTGTFTLIGRIQSNYNNVETFDIEIRQRTNGGGGCAIHEPFKIAQCSEPIRVLADVANDCDYNNDFTSVWVRGTSVVFSMEKDGVSIPAVGDAITFPFEQKVKGFKVVWRDVVDLDGKLDVGCWKIKAVVDGEDVFFGEYLFQNFTGWSSQNDVRVTTYIDNYSVRDGVNFRDSGFVSTLRFKGIFGFMQPNYEVEEVVYSGRNAEIVRNQANRKYELRSDALRCDLTSQLDHTYLLLASKILIDDYNANNHLSFVGVEVILDGSNPVKYDYSKGSNYAKVNITFKDRFRIDENRYSGGDGFGLSGSIGGACAVKCEDVTVEINGVFFDDVQSGTAIDIPVIDTNSTPIGSKVGLTWVVPDTTIERRHLWAAPYSYCGVAPHGTAESAGIWNIERIEVVGATTVKKHATGAWDDVLTLIYI